MSRSFSLVVAVAVCGAVAGCAPRGADVGARAAALTIAFPVDAAAGAHVLGASADGALVAYCVDAAGAPELRLYDVASRAVIRVGSSRCLGAVVFSDDARFVAYGDDGGRMLVYDVARGAAVEVAAAGSGAGVWFSPSSTWLVVARRGDAPGTVMLDAWEADLTTHTTIAQRSYAAPFADPHLPLSQPLSFSPDGERLRYFDDVVMPHPHGTLALWSHAARRRRVIASAVPVGSVVVAADWRRIAFVADVVQTSDGWRGELRVADPRTGAATLVAADVQAQPLALTGDDDRLVYFASAGRSAFGAGALVVRVLGAGRSFTLAEDAVAATAPFGGPGGVAIDPAAGQIAFAAAGAQPPLVAVRVAALPDAGTTETPAATTLATDAPLLGRFGFVAGGGALLFAHGADAATPFGTLATWDVAGGAVRDISASALVLAQPIDAWAPAIPFVGGIQLGGGGTLQAWDPWTATARPLGPIASPRSLQSDATGLFVAWAEPSASPAGPTTPLTLATAWTLGARGANVVAADATSFAVVGAGRVVYASAAGLFDALAW